MSKQYGINEVPESTSPVTFKVIDQYQQKYPSLVVKRTRKNLNILFSCRP